MRSHINSTKLCAKRSLAYRAGESPVAEGEPISLVSLFFLNVLLRTFHFQGCLAAQRFQHTGIKVQRRLTPMFDRKWTCCEKAI